MSNGQEPIFNETAREHGNDDVSYPNVDQQSQQTGSTFGAPPMGEPAEPSSHPDNITAASQTTGTEPAVAPTSAPRSGPVSGGLGRQPSGSFDKAGLGGGGGLRRQYSGAYDASSGSKTDKGLPNGAPVNTTRTDSFQQTPGQPGVASTAPVGSQPGSPYVQTQDVPSTGKGPMNMIVENFNKWASKAEGVAGNMWGHLKVGPSMTDAAWGRMAQGAKYVQEGGFEGMYKGTFGMDDGEQLRKTYACYLSTSTGPVAGTLYVSNLKFSFCSDRPLSYVPTNGQQSWSYYKVVVPLAKVKEVVPSANENKPTEKYIQVLSQDGHDFWFMGFVNYDKGVKNMQLALQHIGEIDPNGGLKSPFSGMRTSSHQPQGYGQGRTNAPGMVPNNNGQATTASPPTYPAQQGESTANPGNPYMVTK